MKTNKNLVSVIMSVYNSENTLEKSIESILNQTYQDIEFLILDDCSEDNSWKILKKYNNNSNNIRVFKNNENLGLTKSLNILLSKTKGNYIARQDSDDTSDITRIEDQLSFIKKNNINACTTRARSKQTGKILPKFSYYLPLKFVIKLKNPFIHGTLLIDKKTLNELNGYDESFYYSQDYKLVKDLIINNFKIKIMKDVLYTLNMSNNISTNHIEEQEYYAKCVQKNKIPNYLDNES